MCDLYSWAADNAYGLGDPYDQRPMAVPVLLVDDHGVIAESLKMALGVHGFDPVSSISDNLSPESVLAAARDVEARIVLLDLHLGGR